MIKNQPTPPEGEAVPEQRETPKYWQCPNNEAHPLKFGEKIYGTSTYRMYCLDCPNTVAVFRSKPIPAPVVSTADMTAAEHLKQCCACNHGRTPCIEYQRNWPVVSTAAPEPLYTEQELKDQGLVAVTTDYGKEGSATMYVPVAPESYKPAEGPERKGIVFSDKGIEICKEIVARELEKNPENFKAACAILGLQYELPAATPVTVEAPNGLRKLATWLEGWKLVEDIHANVALQVAIDQLFDAEENGTVIELFSAATPVTVEAPNGLRKLATWLEGWKLVEDIHANVALQVAIDQLFDAEENGTVIELFSAATPVTVEAPNVEEIARRIAICEKNGTKWAPFKVAEIKHLLATPKPIGDVEAVAEQIAGPVLILARGMTYEGFREHIKDILSPLFAPAGPEKEKK